MSRLIIHIEVAATSDTRDTHSVIREMQERANELKMNFSANVNGIHLTCSPGDDAQKHIQFYDRNFTRRGIRPVPSFREGA